MVGSLRTFGTQGAAAALRTIEFLVLCHRRQDFASAAKVEGQGAFVCRGESLCGETTVNEINRRRTA